MADTVSTTDSDRFTVRVTSDSHFGWIRTRLSLERTMMSWLRTATALIGFGFAIVQYFNHLQQVPGARPAYLPTAPEYLGLALISCGVGALVVAIWQYQSTVRYLWSGSFERIAAREVKHSPVQAIAIVLICVGIFAFFAVLLRLT